MARMCLFFNISALDRDVRLLAEKVLVLGHRKVW